MLFAGAEVLALRWIELGWIEPSWLESDSQLSATGAGPLSLVSGVGVTAGAYGLFGLLYGSLSAPLTRSRNSRWLAAWGLAMILSGALLAHLVSAVLCLYSGSYLTVSALQFTLNSFSHVSGAALSGHGLTLLLMVLFSLALSAVLTLLLGRPLNPSGPTPWTYAFFSVPSVALLGFEGFDDHRYEHEVWRTTPELAFYSSLEARALPWHTEPVQKRVMRQGPARQAGAIWDRAALPDDEMPNVLLVMLESVSTRFVGHLGSDVSVTPHLDRLAANGVVMRRAWTTATHSNYAQMAVLSSLFPRRGGGLDTYQRLDYPRFLLHDALHSLDYATATISSQDESWQGMDRFQRTKSPTHFVDARQLGGMRIDIGSERIVPDHVTTRRALDWIRSQPGRWSLYVNLQATHFPYRLAKGIARPFQPTEIEPGTFDYLRYPRSAHEAAANRYKNALSYVDQQLGTMARELTEMGELDNTLWIITSDHGELFHEHGLVTHGRTLYEPEARVPLVLHWPDRFDPAINESPVSTLDVLPTVLDAIGAPAHPAHQGASMLASDSSADGGRPGRAILFNIQGLRSMMGIVCWPHKLVVEAANNRTRLFHLERDPTEQTDLSGAEPARTERLRQLLLRVIQEQDRYHRGPSAQRKRRYAPRIPNCPREPAASGSE